MDENINNRISVLENEVRQLKIIAQEMIKGKKNCKIQDLNIREFDNELELTWTFFNKKEGDKVKIVRKILESPKTITDGEVVYDGDAEIFVDKNLKNYMKYYYRFFPYTQNGAYDCSERLKMFGIPMLQLRYLYNKGDVCNWVSGGWSKNNNSYVEFKQDIIYLESNNDIKQSSIQTQNKINLTNFKTMIVSGEWCSELDPYKKDGKQIYDYIKIIKVSNDINSEHTITEDDVIYEYKLYGSKTNDIKIDISNLNNEYKILIYLFHNTNITNNKKTKAYMKIKEIKLIGNEKK